MRIYLFPFPWFLFEKRIQYLPHGWRKNFAKFKFYIYLHKQLSFRCSFVIRNRIIPLTLNNIFRNPKKKFLIFVNLEFWGRSVQEICKKSRKLGMDWVRTSLSSNISLNGNCYILFLGAGRTGGQCLIRMIKSMITPFRLKSWIKSLKQMPGFVGRQPPQAFRDS